MNTKKILLLILIPLLLVAGCKPEDDPSLEISPNSEFDPTIIKTLEAYDLHISDFKETGNGSISNESGTPNQRQKSHITKKSIAIGSEKITYYETSGRGPDVLLIHGNAQSSNSFAFQLNSVLSQVFHIISIDLPGHGASQRSPNPSVTYQVTGHADLLVKLVSALHMENAVIVGWSLGGNILLQAADRLTDVRGMMIVGTSPVANPYDPRAFIPSEVFGLLFKPDLTEAEIQMVVPSLFRPGISNIPEVFYKDIRNQDPLARLFLGVTLATGNYTDQVGIVRNLSVPLAVLDGEKEQITNIAYQQGLTIPTLWRNKVWVIPHAGHIAQWENPVYFNVLLAAFVIESNLNQ